jgi:hypothetical protein
MSSIANKMTKEEYNYINVKEKETKLLKLGEIKMMKEISKKNKDVIEKKLENICNQNVSFFEDILKYTKFDDIDYYFDKYRKINEDKNNVENDDLLVFSTTPTVSKEYFSSLFLINILRFKLNIIERDLKLTKDWGDDLEEQNNGYLNEIEELEKLVENLKKPDPKLINRIVNLREKCLAKNKRISYMNYLVLILSYIIYFTPDVVIGHIFYCLSISNNILILSFNLFCDFVYFSLNNLYNLYDSYPNEFYLIFLSIILLYLIFKIIHCCCCKKNEEKNLGNKKKKD